MPVHKKIRRKLKKTAKKVRKGLKKLQVSEIGQAILDQLPDVTIEEIKLALIEEGISIAIDLVCALLMAEFGFPSGVCSIIAEWIVKEIRKQI